jgi:hypothetical protein
MEIEGEQPDVYMRGVEQRALDLPSRHLITLALFSPTFFAFKGFLP